jgi:hypothetical protein
LFAGSGFTLAEPESEGETGESKGSRLSHGTAITASPTPSNFEAKKVQLLIQDVRATNLFTQHYEGPSFALRRFVREDAHLQILRRASKQPASKQTWALRVAWQCWT